MIAKLQWLLWWVDVQVLRAVSKPEPKYWETISEAAWDLELAGKWQGRVLRPVVDVVMLPFDGKNHCQRVWIEAQAERANLGKT